MRNNKKGFTLIELLAVIVILAIIALIATPIVLQIIEKARRSAAQDTVYGVISAAKSSYMETLLDSAQVKLPAVVKCDGTACVFYDETGNNKQTYTEDGTSKDFTVKFSGTQPETGSSFTITSDGKIADVAKGGIRVNNFNCSIENENAKCE